MRDLAGQGGMYLTGEFSINKSGGPLWRTPTSNNALKWAPTQRSCAPASSPTPQSCGLRVALRAQAGGGWYVLDNLKGTFSFEGLTFRTDPVNAGFGGDSAAFKREVLKLGLPSEIEISDGAFTLAVANKAGWRNNRIGAPGADPSFRQTNLVSFVVNGTLKTEGNLLVFPR